MYGPWAIQNDPRRGADAYECERDEWDDADDEARDAAAYLWRHYESADQMTRYDPPADE
jgi:hypothetical protein